MSKKIIISMLLAIMLIAQLSSILYAATTIDTTQKASLTIVEYENFYKDGENNTQNNPIKDVEITIYKINEDYDYLTASELENYLSQGVITTDSFVKTTGSDGKVQFTNLDLGRYLVVETNSPERVKVRMESFLIDLPRTSDDGKSWIYDVTVVPKNIAIYGDVLFTNLSKDSNPVYDISWILQQKNSQNKWENFGTSPYVSTDSYGEIKISNLPVGTYRFLMTSTPPNYILDMSNLPEFEITKNNTSISLSTLVEKPSIDIKIKTSDGYGNSASADIQDKVEWKVTADIPTIIQKMNTYTIFQSLSNELDLVENSINVYADDTLLTLNEDYTITDGTENGGHGFTINFTTQSLIDSDSVNFTYKTKFNNSVVYGVPLTCSSTLKYTNIMDINQINIGISRVYSPSVEVHTGALTIKNVDSNENPLSGAKFKISKTKDDAKNNIFIKDPNKNDGSDLIATSNYDGYLTFYGLKYGNDNENAYSASSNYYITEIEAPTYVENGETKHYQLLSDSVELSVNSYSGDQDYYCYKVVHKKSLDLPITGSTGILGLIIVGSFIIILAIRKNKKDEKSKI